MKHRIAAIVLLNAATFAAADEAWTLVTADLGAASVALKSIDSTGVTFTGADEKSKTVPLDQVVELSRSTGPAVAGLVLCVADGQRLVGRPVRIDGANLVWNADKVGELPVPLESVLGILRDRTTADDLSATRAEDQAKLGTGDSVKGILTEVARDKFVFTPAAGEPISVAETSVASILFATPPNGRPTPAMPKFLVHVGSSVVAADMVTLDGATLKLTGPAGADVKVTMADVRAVEHTGGAIAWLSSRTPSEATQTAYFGGSFPARMNASVLGRPIQFGGRTYAHGIGVHSRSKLVYAVQPGDTKFRTQYAIDGTLPQADVDVRVSLDGKVVHSADGVKAGALSPVVEVDLSGGKTLTLEVDYGKGYDIQDRLNWIEPAIVRGK